MAPETHRSPFSEYLLAGLFLLVLALTNGVHANGLPLFKEEPRRVTIAQEMLLTGEYTAPTVFQVPYYRKPPLHNWLIAACAGPDGKLTNVEARASSLVCVVALGLAVFLFARRSAPEASALTALALATVNGMVLFEYGRTAQPDVPLALCCFLAYALFMAFPRSRLALVCSGLAMGGAILIKGYGPLFFYPGLLLYGLIWENENKRFCLRLLEHLAYALLPVLAWLAAFALERDLSVFFATLQSEVALRQGSSLSELLQHLVLFPLKVLGYALPIPLVALAFRKHVRLVRSPVFLSSCCILGTAFVTFWLLSRSLERYFLPALPLAALVVAHFVPGGATFDPRVKKLLLGLGALALIPLAGFLGWRGGVETVLWLTVPVLGLGGYALYRGNRFGLNLLACCLVVLCLVEHGYYQAKNLDSPDPEPLITRLDAVMTSAEYETGPLPWIIDSDGGLTAAGEPRNFWPIEVGAPFTCRTGRLGVDENVARKRGLLAGPHLLWTQRLDTPGCTLLTSAEFAKGPSPFHVLRCGSR